MWQRQSNVLTQPESFWHPTPASEQDCTRHEEIFASMMQSRKNFLVSFLSAQSAVTATRPPTVDSESGLIVLLVRTPLPER
jgi:hypothetical protein